MYITNKMYEVHTQPVRDIFIKLSLLQNFFTTENGNEVRKFKKIDEIQGYSIGGSISIDGNSSHRRSCSVNMIVWDDNIRIAEDSKIWMDKWVKIEIGITHLLTNEIVWFQKGIFAVYSPSVGFSATTNELSFQGVDLMGMLDGTLGGVLENNTIIPAGTPVNDAIKTTVSYFGKISESDIYLESNNFTIPYDIEKSATDNVYSILDEIRELYMDWEIFFDVNGRLVYQKTPSKNFIADLGSEIVSFSFIEENEMVVDYKKDYNFQNVFNKIIVYGRTDDTGVQQYYETINDNPDSPFNVNTDIGIIPHVITNDKLATPEQVKQYGDYHLILKSNFNEQLNINCLPIYFLDANQLIETNRSEIGGNEKYIIDTINIPLSYSGTMSISSHRVYELKNI